MNRYERISFLSCLTILLYSISIYIASRNVVFPFPLFDFFLLFISLSFLFYDVNDKPGFKQLIPGILIFLSFVLALSSNVFIGSFFEDSTFIEWLDSDGLQVVLIAKEFLWISAIILWINSMHVLKYLYVSIFLIIYVLAQIESTGVLLNLLPILVFTLFLWRQANKNWRSIFLVQGILNGMTIYMFNLS